MFHFIQKIQTDNKSKDHGLTTIVLDNVPCNFLESVCAWNFVCATYQELVQCRVGG